MIINSLYINIPFCDRICHYCFFKKYLTNKLDKKSYIDSLVEEFNFYKKHYNFNIKTIYIGGGTPSSLNKEELKYLLDKFNKEIIFCDEITFEANIESLTLEKIKILNGYGVNRVSLGVETFNLELLNILGRKHNVFDTISCYNSLIENNIKNININLLFGIPTQDMSSLDIDLFYLKLLNPKHISYYNLFIEKNSLFNDFLKKNKLSVINDESEYRMYYKIKKSLKSLNYKHYELNHWTKNKYCLHNLNYWNYNSYIGLGINSHSLYKNTFFKNKNNFTDYVNNKFIYEKTIFNKKESLENFIILSLRKTEGIYFKEINERFNIDFIKKFSKEIKKHVDLNNIIIEKNNLYIKSDKLFISDFIINDFII